MENKNIWVVGAINSKSDLFLGNLNKVVTMQSASAQFKKPVFIYITSGEKIKKGDCFLTKNNAIGCHKGNEIRLSDSDKKIIITNDPELIEIGVQKIPNNFLLWWLDNQIQYVNISTNESLKDVNRYYCIEKHESFKDASRFVSEGEKPKGYTTVIRILDNGKELEWENCFYDNGWYDKLGSYIPNVTKWEVMINKCTCEKLYDDNCAYCQEESKRILYEAKKRAEYLDTLENASEKYVGYGMELYDGDDHVKYDAFIAGAKWQFEQELDIASGYLNANLENIEKIKQLFTEKHIVDFGNYLKSGFKPDDTGSLWQDYLGNNYSTEQLLEKFKTKQKK